MSDGVALKPEDDHFLYALYASTRQEETAFFGRSSDALERAARYIVSEMDSADTLIDASLLPVFVINDLERRI